MQEWTWLPATPNGVLAALETPDADVYTAPTLPVVVRCVVLVMELALVSGVAFLLLLTSSVLGNVVRSLLHVVGGALVSEDAVVQIWEAAAFGWGFVLFMSWFLQQSKLELVRRLTGFGWSSVKSCTMSVLIHWTAVSVLVLWQQGQEDEVLVSMVNVHSALYRSDGSLATAELLQNLLLAPVKEELFFRGVIVLVAINRLQSAKVSGVLSGVLFAAIHLTNARHLGTYYSVSYLALQFAWALLVGLFLALTFAVRGSLVECLVLHVINNIFALSVSKQVTLNLTQPLSFVSMITGLVIYAVAITRQLQQLQRKRTSGKQL